MLGKRILKSLHGIAQELAAIGTAVSTVFAIAWYGRLSMAKPRVKQRKIVLGEPAACRQGVYVPSRLEVSCSNCVLAWFWTSLLIAKAMYQRRFNVNVNGDILDDGVGRLQCTHEQVQNRLPASTALPCPSK